MRFFNALLVIAAVVLGSTSSQVAGENLEVSSPLHRLLFEISRYEAHVLDHPRNTAVAVGAVAANTAAIDQANIVKGNVNGVNKQTNKADVSQKAEAKNTGAVSATATGKGKNTAVAAGAVAANTAAIDQANIVKGNVNGVNTQTNTAKVDQSASATNTGKVTATAQGGGSNTAVAAGAVAANTAKVEQTNFVGGNVNGANTQTNTASVKQSASATNSGAVTAQAGP